MQEIAISLSRYSFHTYPDPFHFLTRGKKCISCISCRKTTYWRLIHFKPLPPCSNCSTAFTASCSVANHVG